MTALMPPFWLIRLAVAAVWLYEGLWCKLLHGEPRQVQVVEAVPYFGPRVGVLFLKQIAERPPLHLRLLLPLPIRTEGRKSGVGDARCVYEGGHLLKRVTRIDRGRRYEFEVVEQDLAVGGGMRLLGGGYTLRELPDGRAEVALETRYVSPKHPRWLWTPIEAAVCHTFHRYILGTMRRNTESCDRLTATRTGGRSGRTDSS